MNLVHVYAYLCILRFVCLYVYIYMHKPLLYVYVFVYVRVCACMCGVQHVRSNKSSEFLLLVGEKGTRLVGMVLSLGSVKKERENTQSVQLLIQLEWESTQCRLAMKFEECHSAPVHLEDNEKMHA